MEEQIKPVACDYLMADGKTPLLEYLRYTIDEVITDEWTEGYEECKRRLYKILSPQQGLISETVQQLQRENVEVKQENGTLHMLCEDRFNEISELRAELAATKQENLKLQKRNDTQAETIMLQDDELAAAKQQLAEDEEIRDSISDLAVFMCKTWTAIDKFVYEKCGDAVMFYPVIQGTKNQLDLEKIGEKDFSQDGVRKAISFLISVSASTAQSAPEEKAE